MKISNPQISNLRLSEIIDFNSGKNFMQIREKSREINSEGLMHRKVKFHLSCWEEKRRQVEMEVAPLTIDAVLTHLCTAKGSGRRSAYYCRLYFCDKGGEN